MLMIYQVITYSRDSLFQEAIIIKVAIMLTIPVSIVGVLLSLSLALFLRSDISRFQVFTLLIRYVMSQIPEIPKAAVQSRYAVMRECAAVLLRPDGSRIFSYRSKQTSVSSAKAAAQKQLCELISPIA